MYVRTENGDLLTEKKAIRVRFPYTPLCKKELGIEANCLGRTRDYLLLRKKLT